MAVLGDSLNKFGGNVSYFFLVPVSDNSRV
jgi:hypothetical protein